MQDKINTLSRSIVDCLRSRKYSTPFYFYQLDHAIDQINAIRNVVNQRVQIYYALKANPAVPIVRELAKHLDGVDIASGGEAKIVLEAGSAIESASFAGPAKSNRELEYVISQGIGLISVESVNELIRIQSIAEELGAIQDIVVRVNPDSPIQQYSLKMGGVASPFGIDNEQLEEFFGKLPHCPNLQFKGVHVYSGTQCLDSLSLIRNFEDVFGVARQVEEEFGQKVAIINFGGGFGIPYFEEDISLDLSAPLEFLIQQLDNWERNRVHEHPISAILELGRFIIGEAGVYVAKIVDKKSSKNKKFCILDGGLNHNLAATGNFGQVIRRPYRVRNLSKLDVRHAFESVELVGPLCTSIDRFGTVNLTDPQIGDLIGIFSSGAYGFTASPRDFLGHPEPAQYVYKGEICVQETPAA
jgi:diaminopimelate decarboxylase